MLSDSVRNLTIAFGLRAFAANIVGVFLPLLMLERGASLRDICQFYIAYALVKLAIEYPSFVSIERRSLRFGAGLALAATVGYLLLLYRYVDSGSVWAIALAPAAQAVMNSCLWNTQHIYLSRALGGQRLARDMARVNVVLRVATLAGPPVGGAVAALMGQHSLVLTAAVLSLAAIVPVWSIPSLSGPPPSKGAGWRPELLRDLLANLSFNAHSAFAYFLWPMYLAVVVGTFAGIGVLSAVIDIISLVLMLAAGKRSDRGATHRVLIEGTIAAMAGYVARIFATTSLGIALIGGGANAALLYQLVPWESTYYDHARRLGSRYILWMEFAGDIGYLLVWSALYALTYVTAAPHEFFLGSFLLATVCCAGCLFINRRHAFDDMSPQVAES